MKTIIRWELTKLRDMQHMPEFMVRFIDWLRYGWFVVDEQETLEHCNSCWRMVHVVNHKCGKCRADM